MISLGDKYRSISRKTVFSNDDSACSAAECRCSVMALTSHPQAASESSASRMSNFSQDQTSHMQRMERMFLSSSFWVDMIREGVVLSGLGEPLRRAVVSSDLRARSRDLVLR